MDLQHVVSDKKWTGHKVDWDEIHPSLPATICVRCDPVAVAMDVCACWCKAHMGPPTAVPLRDVSCVIILLYLFLLLSIAPPLSLQALTSGKTLRYVWGLVEMWSATLVNRAKNADALWWFASGRGGKWPGSLPDTPWLSDLWRPRCMSSSSAMQQDVCSLPLTAQPRRTESGVVSVMLTLPQPHCRDSRLLPHSVGELLSSSSKPNFLPTKVKKKQKNCRSSQTY